MDNNENFDIVFEDISSHSEKPSDKVKRFADSYGKGAFKNIDRIIKIISFIVAAAVFVLFLCVAVVLVIIDKAFIFLSALALLLGAALALIFLFLIYAIGHIISQNNEILKR